MRIIKTTLVWILGILLCGPVIGHAHPAEPSLEDLDDFFQMCASVADAFPVDVRIPYNRRYYSGTGPSMHSGQNPESCLDYTIFSAPFVTNPSATFPHTWVIVSYVGDNVTTSAWDCNHTALTFAVLVRPSGGAFFSLASFGRIYGSLENGVCTHRNPEIFPSGMHAHPPHMGSKKNGTTYLNGQGEILIMASSWAHNDPAIGHPGNLSCSPDLSCYFGAKVTIVPPSFP